MVSKTIKISEENYRRLLNIASEMQKQRAERVSFDDALQIMGTTKIRKTKAKKLSDLAGRWSMNNGESNNFIKEIYKERRIISKRL